MIHKVAMPRFGQTMEEGTIERWAKQVGDDVALGEVLLEITTDKATLEVEAFVEGTVRKVLAAEGDTVKCGRVIALVGDADEELPDIDEDAVVEVPAAAEAPALAPAPAAAPAALAPAPAPAAPVPAAVAPAAPSAASLVTATGRVSASPRARRRAAIEKVPVDILAGSGPNGRVVEADVLSYAQEVADLKATPLAREVALERGVDMRRVTGRGAGGRITKEDALAAAPSLPAKDEVVALSAMRRVVAQRMFESKRDIPHFYLQVELDMTDLVAHRSRLNEEGPVKISFNDFIMKACAMAFKDNPAMGSVWAGDSVVVKGQINIGIAVAIDDGLIVPVVKDADRKGLEEIAAESRALIEKARSKRLTPEEYEDGRLTISNLGMMDIDCFIPIVNPGEAAILGIGRIADKVVVIDRGIHVRSMMWVTLSADHRVVDGAVAASFLKQVKDLLECPAQIA